MEISLQELAGGALQEKVNQAFEKVMQNMQDPNTPWKNKRKINVGITFVQNDDRTDCTCDISVDVKLAAVKPVSTKFCTQKDLTTGEIFPDCRSERSNPRPFSEPEWHFPPLHNVRHSSPTGSLCYRKHSFLPPVPD